MVRCTFCGIEIERGTGKNVVQKDGAVLHFCAMKCEKNLLKLGRNPMRVKWTLRSQKFRGKLKGAEALALEEGKEVKKEAKRAKLVIEGSEKEPEKVVDVRKAVEDVEKEKK